MSGCEGEGAGAAMVVLVSCPRHGGRVSQAVEVTLALCPRRILIVEVVSSSSLHEVASSHRTHSLLLREVAPLRTSTGQGRGPAIVVG